MSDDSSSTVVEVEMRDLQDRREELLNAARRHTLWAVLGLSPGAIIPLVVSVGEMGMGVFVAALVAMTGTETVRAVRARREADAIGPPCHAVTAPRVHGTRFHKWFRKVIRDQTTCVPVDGGPGPLERHGL